MITLATRPQCTPCDGSDAGGAVAFSCVRLRDFVVKWLTCGGHKKWCFRGGAQWKVRRLVGFTVLESHSTFDLSLTSHPPSLHDFKVVDSSLASFLCGRNSEAIANSADKLPYTHPLTPDYFLRIYSSFHSIPSMALQPLLGPGLPRKMPPFFPVFCSSPPPSYF